METPAIFQNEALVPVFRYLSPGDLRMVRLVCQNWNNASNILSSWTLYYENSVRYMFAEFLKSCGKNPMVRFKRLVLKDPIVLCAGDLEELGRYIEDVEFHGAIGVEWCLKPVLRQLKKLKRLVIVCPPNNQFLYGEKIFPRKELPSTSTSPFITETGFSEMKKALADVEDLTLSGINITRYQFFDLVSLMPNLKKLRLVALYVAPLDLFYFSESEDADLLWEENQDIGNNNFRNNFDTLLSWFNVLRFLYRRSKSIKEITLLYDEDVDYEVYTDSDVIRTSKIWKTCDILNDIISIPNMCLEKLTLPFYRLGQYIHFLSCFNNTLKGLGDCFLWNRENTEPQMYIRMATHSDQVEVLPNCLHSLEQATFLIFCPNGIVPILDFSQVVSNYTNIKTVRIRWYGEFNEECHYQMSKLPNMNTLELDCPNSWISQSIIENICFWAPKLTKLFIHCEAIEPSSFSNMMGTLKNLKELSLIFREDFDLNDDISTDFSDSSSSELLGFTSLNSLSYLTELEYLHIDCYGITDEVLEFGFTLPKLRKLIMGRLIDVTEIGIRDLTENCPLLEDIELNCMKYTTQWMVDILMNLPRIRSLKIRHAVLQSLEFYEHAYITVLAYAKNEHIKHHWCQELYNQRAIFKDNLPTVYEVTSSTDDSNDFISVPPIE